MTHAIVKYCFQMRPEYVTVYQISKESTDWSFALAGAIPLLVGIVIILGKRQFGWKRPNWILPIFACGFGLLWLCTAGVSVVREDSHALNAFQKGDFQIVEGEVTDFKPMPYEGHQDECFSVQDGQFCYSDYVIAPGFRNTASHGGPIRAGLPVRIAYSGDAMLRLEIPKDRVLNQSEIVATTNSAEQAWQTRANNDPVERRMTVAFIFTAICWTLWWNVQWKRVMRFWVRPPNRPWVQYAFRVFFALNLIGAICQFAMELHSHPLARQEIVPTIGIAAVMCVVVAIMSAFVLWMAQRRDQRDIGNVGTQG
jgi:hypothetical protein